MVNKCVETNCKTGYSNGQKKSTFHFPEERDLPEHGYTLLIENIGFHPNIQLFALTILMTNLLNVEKDAP